MTSLEDYVALLLLIGWFLALKRQGWRARSMVMASVPVGGFFGGFCGGGLCSLVLHLQGRGESHNDLISFAAAGLFGMLVGGIASPVIALFLTRTKKG